MPLYEYSCKNCKEVVEVFQHLSSSGSLPEELKSYNCQMGGKCEFHRLFPTSGIFELKGKGWAKDNYSSG